MAHRWPMPPSLPQADYEPPYMVIGDRYTINRRLEALGNAVVPQVVYPIFYYLYQFLCEVNHE